MRFATIDGALASNERATDDSLRILELCPGLDSPGPRPDRPNRSSPEPLDRSVSVSAAVRGIEHLHRSSLDRRGILPTPRSRYFDQILAVEMISWTLTPQYPDTFHPSFSLSQSPNPRKPSDPTSSIKARKPTLWDRLSRPMTTASHSRLDHMIPLILAGMIA